jgi:PAS domain S-box-containing protein
MAELPNPEPSQEIDRAGWIAFVQLAPVPLLLIDNARIVLAASPTAIELLASSRDAPGHAQVLDLLQPAIEQHLAGAFDLMHGDRCLQAAIGWIDRNNPALALVQLTNTTPMLNQLQTRIDQFEALIDSTHDLVSIKDLQGRFTLVNTASRIFLNCEPDDCIGKTVFELLPRDLAETIWALEQRVMSGATETEIHEFDRGDRGLLVVETIKTPIRGPGGDVVAIGGISRDITRRRLDEQALAEQRSLLNAIIESSPDMIFAKDPDERYILSNRASAASYGLEPGEMIGRTDAEIVGHDVPLFRTQNQQIIATGERLQYETSMAYFGKPDVHHLTRKAPLRNAAGEIIGVVGITTDISEQKLAEQALADRNALINAIIENLPDPVFAKDLNGQYVLANEAAADDFGITVEQMVNRPIHEFLRPDVAAEFLAEDAAVLAGDAAIVFEKELDIRGKHTYLSTRKAPLRNASGELIGILGSAVDLTDRHNRELALQQAKADAEEASRLKSSFLSTMSHELRTPLNAIIGFAHLLLDGLDGPLAPQQRADVQRIATGADHLLTLINDVLDLSRIEAGKLEVSPEPIAVSDLVHAALAEMRPLALERNLLLRETLPESPAIVRADRRRSIQVLLNLISNAVKFTPSGVIQVSIRNAGPWIGIAVSDTGIGIAPAAIPAIFDEFRQLDSSPSRRYGGTGLGLAISRRLAHLQQGEITVASLEGTGSTFTYWLPAANSDALPDPALIPSSSLADLLPHSRSTTERTSYSEF